MRRKIFLSLIIICAAVAAGGSAYYFYFSENQAIPAEEAVAPEPEKLEDKNFFDFIEAKKKLPPEAEEVSLIAVGDISFSRGVERVVKREKDINYPFLKIKDYLAGADLVFGNLETPLTTGPEIPTGEMIFRSNPETTQALKEANLSIVSLANNHTPNFGEKGLKDTFRYLEEAGIKYCGAGLDEAAANEPAYLEIKGIKFAWLCYNDEDVVPESYEAGEARAGTALMRPEKMATAVAEAKAQADFIIISMHSGTEYVGEPNKSQVDFAHAAIEAGADLVLGHHPHVVQTMEKYQGKYIFYSLGNFIFDQSWSDETEEGLALKIYFSKDGLEKIYFQPVAMESLAQPEKASAARADKILKRLEFPLANQKVYFWDDDVNDFLVEGRGVVYEKNESAKGIISRAAEADLDNDQILEKYSLSAGRLAITKNNKMIWQSPDNWWIDNFFLADVDHDGDVDVNLSLWKAGNFGTSQPFWVEQNDMSVKNHFFVYDFSGGFMKQVWGSSNLAAPNCEFALADFNGDGENELAVLEGDYTQAPNCQGKYLAVWKWNGWGFTNIWRSEEGNFVNLKIEKINGKNYLAADSL